MDYFVIKYWRELLIIILVACVSLSVNTCSRKTDDVDLIKNSLDKTFNEAKYYKSKSGKLLGQVKTHEVTISQLKEYGDQMGFKVSDLEKQVGKANRLVAHWKGRAGMRDTIVVTLRDTVITETDSVNDAEKVFMWSNKFLKLNGVINDGNLSLSYDYESKFSLTSYKKKQGMFKRSQLVADVWFEDPNMRVREFKGFVITEPKKKFYEKGLFKVAVGVLVGTAISSKL